MFKFGPFIASQSQDNILSGTSRFNCYSHALTHGSAAACPEQNIQVVILGQLQAGTYWHGLRSLSRPRARALVRKYRNALQER